jgi:hypothetical protein
VYHGLPDRQFRWFLTTLRVLVANEQRAGLSWSRMPVGAGTCAGADCQLVDQSLPAQPTKLATKLDRHRQPAAHPAEGRLSTLTGRWRTAAIGKAGAELSRGVTIRLK